MANPPKIMLIRHAERPAKVGSPYGMTPDGHRDVNSLSTVGWQRSGALIGLFAPNKEPLQDSRLATPGSLFATDVGLGSESKREQQTITALASKLGMEISVKYLKQNHEEIVKEVIASDGVALICWDHKGMSAIANGILRNTTAPQKWKRKRFDLVWVFDWDASTESYSFSQVPQRLLPGDSSKVMKVKKSS